MCEIISGQNKIHSNDELDEKRKDVEEKYGEFLTSLGYDWKNDSNMKDTPRRVAKMYLDEVTKGTYTPRPKITTFKNQTHYSGMVFEGDIIVKSLCSHHMQPFVGKAHIAYIPGESGNVIGLSKLNRLVDWFSRRPQLQEQLTQQIHDELCKIMPDNQGVAVMVEAQHMCVYLRGIEHNSVMKTAQMSKVFFDNEKRSRDEFYRMIADLKTNKNII